MRYEHYDYFWVIDLTQMMENATAHVLPAVF